MAYDKAQLRIVLFGRQGSGKTRFAEEAFNKPLFPEQICAYHVKLVNNIRYAIWDTSGHKKYRNTIKNKFFHDVDLAIYCIDLSNPPHDDKIFSDIRSFKKRNRQAHIVVIGTKADLLQQPSDLEQRISQHYPNHCPAVFITSAMKGWGIEAFQQHLQNLCDQRSPLGYVIEQLKTAFARIKPSSYNALMAEIEDLIETIKADPLSDHAPRVELFKANCIRHLDGHCPTVVPLLVSLVVFVAATIFCMCVGFLIGFAAGSWTGPGAFLSGLAGGAAGACAVIGMGAVAGLTTGFSTLGFFAHRRQQRIAVVERTASAIQQTDFSQELMPITYESRW